MKNGGWLRPKSKNDGNDTECEVPVPVFQQTVKQEGNRLKTEQILATLIFGKFRLQRFLVFRV